MSADITVKSGRMGRRISTNRPKTLILFDVDGTLTRPRQVIDESVKTFLLTKLRSECSIGLVGGSDLHKICEQLDFKAAVPTDGVSHDDVLVNAFDYVFAENGLVAYRSGQLVGKMNIAEHLGEAKCQKLINFALKYMADIELPVKRGNFIEFRSGLINMSPIGRSCSVAQRQEFFALDQKLGIRSKMRDVLYDTFPDADIEFAIGGQISIDAYPVGWDKTFALRYVEEDGCYEDILFFGDKTGPGGNDHAIYEDARTVGYSVTGPDDTIGHLKDLFFNSYR